MHPYSSPYIIHESIFHAKSIPDFPANQRPDKGWEQKQERHSVQTRLERRGSAQRVQGLKGV